MATPLGIQAGRKCLPSPNNPSRAYKWCTLLFTFFIYTSYHLSRKPVSVIKSVLRPDNCSLVIQNGSAPTNQSVTLGPVVVPHCGWAPFDGEHGKAMLGSLDTAFLVPYAIGMFISGHIAERVSLRYFLTVGMLLSGTFSVLFGLGRMFQIHSLSYYIAMQAFSGLAQTTGWPSVVTCVANWFGKGQRGLIMGLWNSHTSFGNILGSVIAGYFVDDNWGLSFIIPGVIIGGLGVLVFFFLVPSPQDVGCVQPNHYTQRTPIRSSDEDPEDSSLVPSSSETIQREEAPLIPSESVLPQDTTEPKAIGFIQALRIPGVIEFSLCLFFAKLVSYVFLFWLPNYITVRMDYSAGISADLSTLFDFGGIVGGVLAGVVSDYAGGRATTCMVMLLLGAPMLQVYSIYGAVSLKVNITLLLVLGALVNGPYALITTAVAADLGTHKSLRGNARALATVTAIIDGTGSIGAAIGPQLASLFTVWQDTFYMLIAADIIAMMMLARMVVKEFQSCCRRQPSTDPETGGSDHG